MRRPERVSSGRVAPCLAGLTLVFLAIATPSLAATEKYRLSLRDDPATTMVIGWRQNGGSAPVVYWDTMDYGQNWAAYASSAPPNHSTSAKGMDNRFLRLTGLAPDTAYYFVIRDSESVSPRFWFRTASDGCGGFTFVAGGDSRNNRTPRRNANTIVSKLRPLFVAFGGDLTDNDTDTQWINWLDDWQDTISADGRMYPILVARGNHEASNAVLRDLFDTPSSNVYYALSFGGPLLRLYTLNSQITEGGTQSSWLAGDLVQNADTHLYSAVQYHKPMRPHNASKAEGNNEYNAWAQLFYDHHVDLVVECDSHVVKRTWPVRPDTGAGSDEGFIEDPDGTVYVGEGGWGAPLRSYNDAKDWTRDGGSFNQVKWIHVKPDELTLRSVATANAASVGSVSDLDPFAVPANLDVWTPSEGAVVSIASDMPDVDLDGTPDACDACPLDSPDDTDGDGVCDSNDPCPVDVNDDSDGDGVCDSSDVCPGFDDSIGPPASSVGASVRLDGTGRLFWDPAAGATEYVVYRGSVSGMYDHVCQATVASPAYTDPEGPGGDVFYYLIAPGNPCGVTTEGLGTDSTGSSRPVPPCP